MPLTDGQRLRQLLGETVSPGDSPSDTLFSEEEIDGFLADNSNIERAAYDGWRVKAAKLSNLVDTTEGNSQKKYSQLLDNATEMLKIYQRSSSGPTEGRTRVGRIKRPGVEWP
jgi:hypothetical protein